MQNQEAMETKVTQVSLSFTTQNYFSIRNSGILCPTSFLTAHSL